MARSRETKIELTAYDDLFQTDESREEAKLSKIRDIPISEIDEFPDHPFKVLMDEDMEQLVESIKRNGVMTPATVRLKEDGRYELISGHRRKKACELAGLETLKCEVKELTRDEAIIVMVESNLQRSVILPSEKAFVMFITSKGTMDKASPEVRKYIAQRAELLGAIRLPDNTFKANAGTEVTSDILILQKRDRVMDIEPDWVHLDTDENGITMNRYFVEHPEMVLGEIKMESTRFGTFEPVCKARKDIPLSELLSNAVQRINGEIPELDNGVDEISDEQELSVPADPNVRNFSFTLVDGRVYFRENDRMQPASVSMTAENRIKGLIQIRDCVRKLIEYQTEDYPEEMICTEQENLNRLYDVYTAKYGLINSRGNYLAFASDESYFLLCSLEVLDDEGNFKRKADMFTKRTIKPHREVTSVETASEALALSIGEKARVDLPYMEQLTGKTQAELVQDLQGVIFKVPNCEPVSYAAADEYLSGNVRNKLTVAELAAKNDPELPKESSSRSNS